MGDWRGFLVPRQESLFINVPVHYGVGSNIELRTNAAHTLMGVPNLSGEWMFVSDDWGAMSISLGALWLHPPFLTVLPDSATEGLGSVHLLSLPLTLTTTLPIQDHIELSVLVSYFYTQFIGEFSDDEQSGLAGGIGSRELVIEPVVLTRAGQYAWLFASLELPLWAESTRAGRRTGRSSAGSRSWGLGQH